MRNDAATVRALYARHYPAVLHYVLENNGRAADAEDMFQEAFAALWLRVKEGKFDAGAEPGPGGFLYQVARNKWLDVLRSAAKKRMDVLHSDHIGEVGAEVVTDDEDQRIARLREVYRLLDDKCRRVLDQFYFERMDLAAIASAMGVGEDSIRTIKYRCMMKLRAFRRKIGGEDQSGK